MNPQNSDSRYLVRFDDICPTMNWEVWEQIEAHLVRHDFKPILAVVPDNRDPKLMRDPARPDFWERVRGWQARGWTIALHGYQHVYVNRDPGMLRLTKQSEFAGLDREEQARKLRSGLAIFAEQGVKADAWVAPSHSFDPTTVDLLAELGIRVISDGLWPMPHRDARGVVWIPQQLWSFLPRPAGVWTVCHHHNDWKERELARFTRDIEAYAGRRTDLAAEAARHGDRALTASDRWHAWRELYWTHGVISFLSDMRRRWLPRK
jgi:predicted deacetylase